MTSTLYVDNLEPNLGSRVTAAGHVVQVKSSTFTNVFTKSGTGWSELTDLRVLITPSSSSSKMLLSLTMAVGQSYWQTMGRFIRNSTVIGVGDARGSRPQSSFTTITYDGNTINEDYEMQMVATQFLDSPATTSQITYGIEIGGWASGYNVYVNRSENDGNTANYVGTPISTLTVMEIAQ